MYIRLKEDYESFGLGTLKAGSIYKLNKKCGEEVYCDFVQKVYAISHKTEYEIANVRINPLEQQFYDIFTTENATERFAKFQEAYELMQKELNEI